MRKVLFKQRNKDLSLSDYIYSGTFHMWASACEDGGDNGFGNYTVALVELADGTVLEIIPTWLKFID